MPIRLANVTLRKLTLLQTKNVGSVHSANEDGEMGAVLSPGKSLEPIMDDEMDSI